MTRTDILTCVHEPFGEAFYYGPEHLKGSRFANDPEARKKSGYENATYKDALDQIEKQGREENKRIFIKDIIYYIVPPNGAKAHIAPSLRETQAQGSAKPGTNGDVTEEAGNPTVLPTSVLRNFHFTFLIRHPRRAIPSYYRCTIPPLDKVTGFYHFMPEEAGYVELRRVFEYLKEQGIVGGEDGVKITVVDADDLLDHPAEVIEKFCQDVGIDYTPEMLKWGDEESQQHANDAFEKWNGFHNDVLGSTGLKPREHGVKTKTEDQEDEEWKEKYGEEGAKLIRKTVNENIEHYEFLKQFAFKI